MFFCLLSKYRKNVYYFIYRSIWHPAPLRRSSLQYSRRPSFQPSQALGIWLNCWLAGSKNNEDWVRKKERSVCNAMCLRRKEVFATRRVDYLIWHNQDFYIVYIYRVIQKGLDCKDDPKLWRNDDLKLNFG